MQIDTLVQAPDPAYLIRAEKELLEHWEHIDQADCGDFVSRQPELLHEAALVDAFDLLDALVDDVELLEVGEILDPVDPVNVVQTEVDRLNVGAVLLVYAEEVARVVQAALQCARLATVVCSITRVFAALSDACRAWVRRRQT